MDFKEKEMNLELKEQDSEHNKKKKEEGDRKSTRLNSSHPLSSRMPSSA